MNESINQSSFEVPKQIYAETGNSHLRAIFDSTTDAIVEALPDRITASHITLAGTATCVATAVIAARYPKLASALSYVNLFGNLTDSLDGKKARKDADEKGETTTSKGALLDTSCDRTSECVAALSQSYLAFKRGNRFGGFMLLAFGATTPLPSLARSNAEANGIVVAEGLLGSRYSRVTFNCLGYFRNQKPAEVNLLATMGTATNLYNAATRLQALRTGSKHNKGQIDPTKQAEAATRRKVLAAYAAGMGVISIVQARRAIKQPA